MDTTKHIARAVLNKSFAEAKDLIFKSLYARASLALDEARYTVAQSIYNSTTEVNEGSWGGGFETSREAWAKHMKQERLEAKRAREAKKAKEKAAAKAKKAVKEETEQLDEKKMKVWSPRLDKLMKNRDKIYVKPPAWLKRQKQREQVKEETEQIDEISKATKDSYVAKRGSQMSSMMRGPEKNYASMTGKKQANAVKGIKRAMGVKEETEQLDEVSPPGMEKMTGSKKVKAAFTKRYGKRGREVMYATAWKQHNKKMAESAELEEGSAVPSRKEALAAIRWGKKAAKDPAKHGVTPDDIRANMKVARDTLRPFGSKKSAPKKMAEETEQIDEVMTRKHFQQVADVIKSNPDAKKREELAAHHSQIFKKSNPRFDEKRFRKACGVGGCD